MNIVKHNIKRRVLPHLDKLLHTGLVRLLSEYESLACKESSLSDKDVDRLCDLTKVILQLRKDKGIEELSDLNRQPSKKDSIDNFEDLTND